MNYTKFNRHESMNAETQSEIMSLIREVRDFESENIMHLENMLYGMFDGYLYEDVQLYALELPTVFCSKVIRVYNICKRYPISETKVF